MNIKQAPILSPKALLHTKHISERWQTRLQIQLRALRQERILAIIIQIEQRRAAFDLRLHETRWRHLDKVGLD